MKASYTKPLLAVEAFSLAQTSARDCADNIPPNNVTSNDPLGCVWNVAPGMSIFMNPGPCMISGEGFTTPEGGIVCYNAPAEGSYIFKS